MKAHRKIISQPILILSLAGLAMMLTPALSQTNSTSTMSTATPSTAPERPAPLIQLQDRPEVDPEGPGPDPLNGRPPRPLGPRGGDRPPPREGQPPPPGGGPQEIRAIWEKIDGGGWLRQALLLEDMAHEFDGLEDRRGKLLKQIGESKNGYQPGVLDPANVVRRRQLDRLLGQMQNVIERERMIELESGWNLNEVRHFRNIVTKAIEAGHGLAGPGIEPKTRDRLVDRWKVGMAALAEKNQTKFASSLLGEALAPLALRNQNPRDDGPPDDDMEGPNPSGPNPGAPGAPVGDEIRRRWVQRQQQVDNLDRRQRDMQDQIRSQSQEIDALRMEIKRLREIVEQNQAPEPAK